MQIPLAKSSGFNCKPGCHECCTLPPLKKSFLLDNQHLIKIQGRVDVVEMVSHCFVMTEDLMCPFLQDGICIVYAKRPRVCRQYGRVKDIPCIYYARSGRERSTAEQQRVKAEWAEKRLKIQMAFKTVK